MKELIISLKLKFIRWFHAQYPGKYCWAGCVNWAYSDKWNPFKVESSKFCEDESKEHSIKSCYCGAWESGICFDTLPLEEQNRIRQERAQETVSAEPPF